MEGKIENKKHESRSKVVSGLGLVALGILFLIGQLTTWEWIGFLILPAMALIFIVWGGLTRTAGLMIPGGIFAGISLGILLMDLPLASQVEDGEGGLFMLGFAGGWVLITLLTAVLTDETHWWALIPAAIMGVIGVAILTGGVFLEMLAYMNYLWPVILIFIGLFLLFRRERFAP